tara:strand:+ start:1428 stop:6101 length:4674 start_codon:yes stop_codon:yes gene_type:complete
MALANVEVTITKPNVTVSGSNTNVSVTTDTTTVSVSNATVISNADIRTAISVANVSGFGNLTYDSSAGSNGVIQYTGVSNSDIRGLFSNTSPITYDSSTGAIGLEQTLDDLTLKKYQETIVTNGNSSGNITAAIASGTVHDYTLTGNITGITLTGISTGGSATLILNQDGGGGHILDTTTHSSNFNGWQFANDNTTIDNTAGAWTIMNVFYDGTRYYASLTLKSELQITNTELANSNITVNGTTISLGSSGNIANFGSLTTNDLTENTNLYYTDARSRAAISVSTASPSGNGSLSYNNTTGSFTFTPANVSSGGGGISLTDLSVTQASASGTGTLAYNNSTGVFTYTPPDLSSFGTSNLTNAQAQAFIQTNGLNGSGAITTTGVATFGNSPTQTHTFTGNLDVTGNIEVSGNLNYRNVEDLFVRDQSITLNANAATDATSSIIINRPVAGANTVIRWNESDDKWQFSNDGSAYQNLIGLTDLSISTGSPSGNGSLSYNNTTGVFTFTPADASGGGISNAQAQAFIQENGLAMTANITSNSLIQTTGNVQFNADTDVSGLSGLTFDSATNNLGLGTPTPKAAIHIRGTSNESQMYMTEFNGGSSAGVDFRTFRSAGTEASPDFVTNNKRIWERFHNAYDSGGSQDDGIDSNIFSTAFAEQVITDGTHSANNVPVFWQIYSYRDGDTSANPTALIKARANGDIEFATPIGSAFDQEALPAVIIDKDGVYTSNANITTTANVSGNYLLGNGSQITGLTNGISLSNLSVTQASASGTGALAYNNTTGVFTYTPPLLTNFIGLSDLSVTTASPSGNGSLAYNSGTGAFTFTPADTSTGGGSGLSNAQVKTFIEANGLNATADIDTSLHLGAANKSYTGGSTYWTPAATTAASFGADAIDALWYVPGDGTNPRTRPNIADGSKIVISGGSGIDQSLSNGSITADNTYYVKNVTPFTGFDVFYLYTDSALSNAVNTGYTNPNLTNPSALNLSYKSFDVVANGSVVNHNTNTDLQGTLDVTGAITASSTLNVSGNIDSSAKINSTGGVLTGALTSNSLISTTGNVQINPDTLAGGLKGFTFDASTNRLGLGTPTPEAAIHIESDNDFDSQIFMKEYKSSNAGNDMRIYKAAGTLASPTTLQSGNRVFEIQNYGYDGSAFQNRLNNFTFVDSTVAVSSGVIPMGWELKGSVDGTSTSTSLFKVRGNGAIQVGSMGGDDSNSGVAFQILNDGTTTTSSSITATGNVTGNYILGNGSQLSGITTSATDSFGTFTVSGQTNIQASQANAQVEFAAGSGMTITTSGNTMTFASSGGGGSYGNTNVQTWLASGNNVGNIETAGNLIVGGVSANVTQAVQAYFGSNNTGSNDQFQPTSDPGHPNSTPITFSGTSNGDITFLNGNTYYTKSLGGGIYEIYTDSLLTTPVQSGTDNEAPSGLVYEYAGTTDITSTIAGTLAVTGETTLASSGANTNVSGNIVMTAGKTLFLSAISTIGGGTLNIASLRVTDFAANDPLGINVVANSSLSGGVYAAPFQGAIVYVTGDRNGSRGAPCYWSGTEWRYFSDDANVTI